MGEASWKCHPTSTEYGRASYETNGAPWYATNGHAPWNGSTRWNENAHATWNGTPWYGSSWDGSAWYAPWYDGSSWMMGGPPGMRPPMGMGMGPPGMFRPPM